MAKSFDELVNRTTSKAVREKAAVRSRKLLAELLQSEIRKLAGKSQRELAEALGMKQPSLSNLKPQDDMRISTLKLKRIIEALGGELRLTRFPGGTVRVNQFDRLRDRKRSSRPRELTLV